MGEVVELTIPPASNHLALVRLVVARAAALERQIPERRVEDLRLAVSEACANALDAQIRVGSRAPIVVRIEVAKDQVAVTVTDHAGGFDPDELSPIPPVTDPMRLTHERGLGIPLMRSLVDEVRFDRTDDGTAVQLVVHT